MKEIILANFGGPRHLEEIPAFLHELLTDRDVIRSKMPSFLHRWIFSRAARKRAVKIRPDYEDIGGKSPIYFDTEEIARALREKLQAKIVTFHRYLPATHDEALEKIEALQGDEIRVLPLFPQFSYATTGSIARFFQENLTPQTCNRLRWIQSYSAHPAFTASYRKRIAHFLDLHQLREEETVLLFSAHGVPLSYIAEGDIYETECKQSYREILKGFPNALGRLSYQSKFGPEEWLKPYTNEVCEEILNWNEKRKSVVIVPITFTSDHIETLYEIERLYLPPIQARGLHAYRCPALNLEPYWIDALAQIAQDSRLSNNVMLIRR